MKTTMLDPGHGGIDPGATGNGYKEKDLTLKLCLDVKTEVNRHGLGVHLTRTDDRYVSLKDRSKIANNLKVDSFVSIHFNSANNVNAKGLEIYHYPNSTKGHELASKIQSELVNANLYLANRGVKSANFAVLRETTMTSSLLEVCFINNAEDIKFFINNYDKYVQAITKAIVEYHGVKYIPPKQEISASSIKDIVLVDDKINIMLLSEHITIDGFIKDGVTYVDINDNYISIRQIFESLGLTVGWDNDLRLITADINKEYKSTDNSIDVLLLRNKISVDTIKHENKNCVKIDGAYIPVRDIFESLGFKVEWNEANNMVLVNKEDK
ncbi:putative cell wall amidase LytH [Gottschalkia acidurici 9a]|uniref:Cell wall amidase LytH n=1 Tax=Gottschalkia acidurici (strain ATCC 7906 / DSM 604 / BCRC 14475 / CIP 104303 / KCTC 5404 / NCIMB 10678 / 9a) TaxID=1128398 RepID=K0AXG8_GOTA9|nr:N-acetylmuramoyl-L-alanine amidase [Gottschalkia acidurici]AFS78518.1 putative cell wall amidase LytH [Gottschalkia acidurici 9a]